MLTISVDIQFLVGLILYIFLSPITKIGVRTLRRPCRSIAVRYFTVEHAVGMIIGLRSFTSHASGSGSRRIPRASIAGDDLLRLAMVIMIISIPWPGLPVSRPAVPAVMTSSAETSRRWT